MYFNFECTHIFQTGKQRNKPKKKKKKKKKNLKKYNKPNMSINIQTQERKN